MPPRALQALVPRGYAFVSVDVRGCGASGGHREVDFSDRERLDFVARNHRVWCLGSVLWCLFCCFRCGTEPPTRSAGICSPRLKKAYTPGLLHVRFRRISRMPEPWRLLPNRFPTMLEFLLALGLRVLSERERS